MLILSFLLLALVIVLPIATLIFLKSNSKKRISKESKSHGLCVICRTPQSSKLRQTNLTGMLIAYKLNNFNDYLCPSDAEKLHHKYQSDTLAKGWWSIYGFVRTPFILAQNRSYYQEYLKSRS